MKIRTDLVISILVTLLFASSFVFFAVRAYDGYIYHQDKYKVSDEQIQSVIDESVRKISSLEEEVVKKKNEASGMKIEMEKEIRRLANREGEKQTAELDYRDRAFEAKTRKIIFKNDLSDLKKNYPRLKFKDDGVLVEDSWFSDSCEFIFKKIGFDVSICSEARQQSKRVNQLCKASEKAEEMADQYRAALGEISSLVAKSKDEIDKARLAIQEYDADVERLAQEIEKTKKEMESPSFKKDTSQAIRHTASIWLVGHDIFLMSLALAGVLFSALRSRQLAGRGHSFNLAPARGMPGSRDSRLSSERLESSSNTLTVLVSADECLYVVPECVNSHHAGQRFIPPFLLSAPVTRVLNGRLRLASIASDHLEKVTLVGWSSGNSKFQVLHVEPGHRVIIKMSSVAGFVVPKVARKSRFRLHTRWMALSKLAYWLKGQVLPTEIVGPARVILYGNKLEKASTPTVNPSQLVAWSPGANLMLISRKPSRLDGYIMSAFLFDNVVKIPEDTEVLVEEIGKADVLSRPIFVLFFHLINGLLIFFFVMWMLRCWA